MVQILTDRDLRHEIERTIRSSKSFIFAVSPYIDFDDDIKRAFSSLENDVVKGIVYRSAGTSNKDSGINDDSRSFLNELPKAELIAVKDLHAKFYLNEECVIIASMNLTRSSNHNHEIGVIIDYELDYDNYHDCLEYLFYGLIESQSSNMDRERLKNLEPKRPFRLEIDGTRVKINDKPVDLAWFETIHNSCNVKHGFCIRCGSTDIKYYPKRPFCPDCYSAWHNFNNPNYEEKFCHRCGLETTTFIDESQCENCQEIYEGEIEREWKRKNS